MTKDGKKICGLVNALVVAVSIFSFASAHTIPSSQATNSQGTMVAALGASGPHSSLGEEARVFDRFVGAWDCDYTFYLDAGGKRHSSGELLFGWIIDGRAMQDIWITYPKDGAKDRGIGTSVRFFDTRSKVWRVTFVSPAYDALITVQGGAEGNRIVLRGTDDEGSSLRWSFNDITPNSFVWRGEKSRDGGKKWVLEEEHHMRRRMSIHQ
jgi:hypothetical protein